MNEVRLGVIGLGNMGSTHVRENLPKVSRCRVTAICDEIPQKMDAYDVHHKFTNGSDLIQSGQVDAILIATPHYSHTTLGIEALHAGLHVLSEKPISVHKADAQRLIDARRDSVFAAMFNQRTDPHYIAIRDLIVSGELGEIRRINWIVTDWFRSAQYYRSGGWRATWAGEGGGVLLNQCPHNLDLYTWMFGLPSKVRAFGGFGRFHDIEVEDAMTAYLEHSNGATGVFVTTTGEAPGTNRLEVVGDRGKVVYEDGKIVFYRTTQSVQEFCDTTPNSFPWMPTWKCEIPANGHGGQHRELLQNFVDAILDGKPLIAPAQEGINSVELANCMIYSALTDQTVVLPLDAAVYEAKLMELISSSKPKEAVDAAMVTSMSDSFR